MMNKKEKAAYAQMLIDLRAAQERLKTFDELVEAVFDDVLKDRLEHMVADAVEEAVSNLSVEVH